jgi:hypothetical protein
MKVRTVFKTVIQLVMCSVLVFTVAFVGGCKGKTGDAGTPGADGTSVGLNDCDKCHHLNSLAVNDFGEIFVDGLAGSNLTISSATSTVISFNASKLPAGETAQSFVWVRTNGETATVSSPTSSLTLITLPTVANYKAELVRHVKGLEIRDLAGTIITGGNRTQIVPVNPLNLDEASSATFKLRVATTSGKFYFGLVTVADKEGQAAVEGFAAVGTGIRNVPVGVPVLIHTKTQASYNWTVAGPLGAVTVADATTQMPSFVPDAAGTYTATDSVGPNTITVIAGNWRGVITSQNADHRPLADECTGCHNGTIAPDKFTPWMNSGHAEILTQNINDPASHWSISGCGPCHSVGYNIAATNNGFDEAVAATGWTFTHGDPNNWTDMLANFSAAAKLANIQCENCHGPQDKVPGTFSDAHTTSPSAVNFNGSRTSLSADVCGACHGEPLRHARFQQWEDSAHGNFAAAIPRATSTSCAGCHTAQGFMVYLAQLQAGNPLRTIQSGTSTVATAMPQTCSVCHDPHAQGTTSGKPNTATVRVEDNTPKLPGGFVATGVGRGAICIVCHNTRNGAGSGAFANDTFLHMDGDPVFGSLTSYGAPHQAAQGDVLMGYNAYFVGSVSPTSSQYRSPHSLITGACVNCHMEQTPPPALLSYNLAGTNHSFKPSITICSNCHSVNQSLGPMLQAKVKSTLEVLEASIEAKIVSRSTDTRVLVSATLTESSGQPAVIGVFSSPTTTTITVQLNNLLGVRISDLGTDALAKAVWNFMLIEGDASEGVHNPDFTLAVLGAAQKAVDDIPNALVPSNEL